MENLTPDLMGRVFTAMWMNMGEKRLQLVATKDIGTIAAQAFSQFDSETYKNQAISLAGDDLNFEEAKVVFWKVYGRSMPVTYGFVGNLAQRMIPELGTMFRWFVTVGYGADISYCRKINPDMLDLEAWFRQVSKFKG